MIFSTDPVDLSRVNAAKEFAEPSTSRKVLLPDLPVLKVNGTMDNTLVSQCLFISPGSLLYFIRLTLQGESTDVTV